MKVKELIEELKIFNPEKNIYGVTTKNLSSTHYSAHEEFNIINTIIRDGRLFLVINEKGYD